MKKGVLLGLVFGILLMSFVSAYYSSSNFSIREVLDNTAPDTIILTLSFVILFAIVSYALGKFFKDNRGISTAISFSISLLAIYGLYKADLFMGIPDFFFKMGVAGDLIYAILPWVFILAIGGLIWYFNACKILTGLGILIIIIGFTDLIYANAITIFAGVLCLALGLFFCFRKKKGSVSSSSTSTSGPAPNPTPTSTGPQKTIVDQKKIRKRYNELIADNRRLTSAITDGKNPKQKGKIPKRGTPYGERYSQNRQEMEWAMAIAKKYGFKL